MKQKFKNIKELGKVHIGHWDNIFMKTNELKDYNKKH